MTCTSLGMPSIALPLAMRDPDDMPLAVQLIGQHGDDCNLLRVADIFETIE